MVCPVCRLPINYDLASLEEAKEPNSGSTVYTLTEKDKATQQKMAEMYQRQKDNGGIIDLEAEKNKYLVPAVSIKMLDIHTCLFHPSNKKDLSLCFCTSSPSSMQSTPSKTGG